MRTASFLLIQPLAPAVRICQKPPFSPVMITSLPPGNDTGVSADSAGTARKGAGAAVTIARSKEYTVVCRYAAPVRKITINSTISVCIVMNKPAAIRLRHSQNTPATAKIAAAITIMLSGRRNIRCCNPREKVFSSPGRVNFSFDRSIA